MHDVMLETIMIIKSRFSSLQAKFFRVGWGHSGVIIRKFGEDQSKTLTMGLFFSPKFPGWGHNKAFPNYTSIISSIIGNSGA